MRRRLARQGGVEGTPIRRWRGKPMGTERPLLGRANSKNCPRQAHILDAKRLAMAGYADGARATCKRGATEAQPTQAAGRFGQRGCVRLTRLPIPM